MEKKETWLVLDKGTRYIGCGLLIDEELFVLDINIFENPHYWGMAIIADNDDGYRCLETAELSDNMLSTTLQLFNLNVAVTVYRSGDSYDISVTYKKHPNEIQ